MSKIKKIAQHVATVAAVSGALTGLTVAEANAMASLVLAPAVALPTAGTYNVVPNCNAGPGVATNLHQITYTVYGTASAYSTNGTTAVATGVTCWIVDTVNGTVYGSISQGLPGPQAAAAGTITVPFNSNPKLCGSANALFSNNRTASNRTLGC